MYSNDDYAGMTIGQLEFYYGYEVTKCLKHPDKSDEYCENMDCDEREWCFEVSLGEKSIWIISKSELKKLRKAILAKAHQTIIRQRLPS